MNLQEISQPSDTAPLESFQDDPSGFPVLLLLEIYRSFATEVKKPGMKPRSTDSGPSNRNPEGVIRILKMATKSIANYTKVPSVNADFDEFLKFKRANPVTPYPGGDKTFMSGAKFANGVPGIREAKLTSDLHVVYVTRPGQNDAGAPVVDVYVFGIYSHADLGIGNNKQTRINDQMATKFKNAMSNPD
jgi:hypothetical protein